MGGSSVTREGGCACGAIRYRVEGDPIFIHACHCKQCQRLTGSAFAITMLVEQTRFTLDRGKPRSGELIAESGRAKRTFFCGGCGSYLWSKPGSWPVLIAVRPGSLDDADWFEPQAHIWTASKQRWVRVPRDVPTFEKAYVHTSLWPRKSIERLEQAGG